MARRWWSFALGVALGLAAGVATGVAIEVALDDPAPAPTVAGPATTVPVPAPTQATALPPPTVPVATTAPAAVPTTTTTPPPPTTSTTTTTTVPTREAEVAAVLAGMSTEEKVGQVFMVEVHGISARVPSAEARRRNVASFGVETAAAVVETYGVGGVIYFGHNIASPEQVAGLSANLQQAAGTGPGLLIATDQEGGRVARIGAPATVFPAARVFGRIGDPALTEEAARVSGVELRAMGVNMVLAPVADVAVVESSVIGDRAFGSDPGVVAEQAAAAVRGYRAGDVAATAKHFPGHGGTPADSHLTLPVLGADFETWAATDLWPFARVVGEQVDAIMVGHLALPAIDESRLPATLSVPLVTGQLRGALQFDGLVITDSLSMEGVRSVAGDGAIAVRALEAGADLLLMPFDFAAARAAVLAATAEPAFAARLDDAVRRVLLLKHDLGVLTPPTFDPLAVAEYVGIDDHRAVLDRVLEAAAGAP